VSEQPKFCKDCDHYTLLGDGMSDDDHVCLVHSHKRLNLVTGLYDIAGDVNCYEEREEDAPCGPHALFFQSRGQGQGQTP